MLQVLYESRSASTPGLLQLHVHLLKTSKHKVFEENCTQWFIQKQNHLMLNDMMTCQQKEI